MPFPDAPKALAWLLSDLVGGIDRSGTETPPELGTDGRHFIRTGRFSGADDGVSDFPLIDVDYFAPTRDLAIDGAELVRDRLLSGYHYVEYPTPTGPKAALIDSVTTAVGPRQLVWLNPRVVRITGTYRVAVRRS